MNRVENRTFLVLVVAVSLAFAWILWPYTGAILWATILAIIFAPSYRRLARSLSGKRTLAALFTLTLILMIVILPVILISSLLLQEGVNLYQRVESGEFDVGAYFQQIYSALPTWSTDLLDRFGLTNLGTIQKRLSSSLIAGSQFLASRALAIGQNAFEFVVDLFIMLYLLFFLLRDGDGINRRIKKAIPLDPKQERALSAKFVAVIRATIKGTIAVALIQGALGGLILWIMGVHAPVLWGALMALLSLLPAVGSALVWIPIAIYFLATGSIWKGIILVLFGVLVIGLVDNVLRPILVGKETKIPDYLVLLASLGGIAIFGINGFVIGPIIAGMFLAVWDIFAEARTGVDISESG